MVMRNIIIYICLSLLVLSAYAKPKVAELPPKAFYAMLKVSPNATIIDVQTSEQFSKVHMKGALPAPEKKDLIKLSASLPKTSKLFIYCREGERSLSAARFLLEDGFKYVYSLKGGLLEWDKYDFPLEVDEK